MSSFLSASFLLIPSVWLRNAGDQRDESAGQSLLHVERLSTGLSGRARSGFLMKQSCSGDLVRDLVRDLEDMSLEYFVGTA